MIRFPRAGAIDRVPTPEISTTISKPGPRIPTQERGSPLGTWLLGKTSDAHPIELHRAASMVIGAADGFQSHIPARFFRWLREINQLRDQYFGKSDAELQNLLAECRDQVQSKGAALTDVLPKVFALVREASRNPGEPHAKAIEQFEVQLLGAMALGENAIARLRTGEGKTFVIPLAAVLYSLEGLGVHVGTRDPFLAREGVEKTKRIFDRLGMRVGLLEAEQTPEQQREACRADVTYGVASSFVYAWLGDQYAVSKEDQVLHGLNGCILDEVDLILAEEALQPLQLSASSDENVDPKTARQIEVAHRIASALGPEEVSVETVQGQTIAVCSERGDAALEREMKKELADEATAIAFGFEPDELDLANFSLWGTDPDDPKTIKMGSTLAGVHLRINNAITARLVLERGAQYIVQDGRVVIVDPNTGNPNPQSRWGQGLMEAVERKEGVTVRGESQLLGMIAYQSFYAMYDRLAGTTGTDEGLKQEFREAWGLKTYHIDSHKPSARKDHPDMVFLNSAPRHLAAIGDVVDQVEQGRPVLVGNREVTDSNEVSELLASDKMGLIADVAVHAEGSFRAALERLRGGAEVLAEFGDEEIDASSRAEFRDRLIEMFRADPDGLRKFAQLLNELGLPATKVLDHGPLKNYVLNAENAREAAQLLRNAGKPRETRSTTNIAGRGVDVELAHASKAAGGLHITAIEHQDDQRQDKQLLGRAGRQGDPGSGRFFVSLDDDLLTKHLPPHRLEALAKTLPRDSFKQPTGRAQKKWTRAVRDAQRSKEANAAGSRRQMARFAEFLHIQWQDILSNQERIRELREIPVEVLDEYQQGFTTLFFAWHLLPGKMRDVDPKDPESAWRGGKIPENWSKEKTARWVAAQESLGSKLDEETVQGLISDIDPEFAATLKGSFTLRQIRALQKQALRGLADRVYERLASLGAELAQGSFESSPNAHVLQMFQRAIGPEVPAGEIPVKVKEAFERSVRANALGVFNEAWKEYLQQVDYLQTTATLRANGRSTPQAEFAIVATEAFMEMKFGFRDRLTLNLVRSLQRFLQHTGRVS